MYADDKTTKQNNLSDDEWNVAVEYILKVIKDLMEERRMLVARVMELENQLWEK